MLGRNSTMNRECSKETRLLHAIAQPAPSVPTTELCMGVWDTHGDWDSAGRRPLFPSEFTEQRQGRESEPLCAWLRLSLTPTQMQVQSYRVQNFFAQFRAIKWKLPLSTWLFLSCEFGPDAKEDLSTYNSVGYSLFRITFLPVPAALCLDMPRTAGI